MRKIFYFFIFIIIFYFIGFFVFLDASKSLHKCEKKVDALVALTGDTGRISEAIRLLRKDKGGVVFITGIRSTLSKNSKLFRKNPRDFQESIVYGRKATNTIENAEETKNWLARNPNISSICLITSDYHLLRSKVVFDSILADYKISTHSIHSMKNKSYKFLIKEYTKYILAKIWHSILGKKGDI
ncbi:MAG: YdcF family protein [Alphaproteobacteria bacterium]